MKMKKANAFATLLLVGHVMFAQDRQAGRIADSGCSVRGFFHQTQTETVQFGHGLESVPRGVVRPSNLKWELPILAATGALIAGVDRPADKRIQSRSLQEVAGGWSNVGLGLEIAS